MLSVLHSFCGSDEDKTLILKYLGNLPRSKASTWKDWSDPWKRCKTIKGVDQKRRGANHTGQAFNVDESRI
jgi:hypothetical protein